LQKEKKEGCALGQNFSILMNGGLGPSMEKGRLVSLIKIQGGTGTDGGRGRGGKGTIAGARGTFLRGVKGWEKGGGKGYWQGLPGS